MRISVSHAIPPEMETKQVEHVVPYFLAIHIHGKQYSRIGHFVLTLSQDEGARSTFLKAEMYPYPVLETSQKLAASPCSKKTNLKSFEALLFLHAPTMVNNSIRCRYRKNAQVCPTSTVIRICVQLVLKAWHLIFEKAGLQFFVNSNFRMSVAQRVISPFFVLLKRSERFFIVTEEVISRYLVSTYASRRCGYQGVGAACGN